MAVAGRIRSALVIAGKDLRQQRRSGVLLVFGLLLPLGLAFLFSTIMPDGEDGFHATFAVADADGGPAARAFVDDVLGDLATGTTFEVRAVDSAGEATALVQRREVAAAFVVPEGFSAAVEAGRPAELRVVGDPDAPIAAAIARDIARSYATELGGVQLAVAVTAAHQPGADPAELAERAATTPFGGSSVLLGASWGPPLGVALLVVAVVLAATGLMAVVATLAPTAEQASNWMSVVAVLLGMFGGAFVPLAQLGDLAVVSYATPHRWFLQGLSDLAAGDLSLVVTPAAILLSFATVMFTLALARIGRVIRP